MKYINNNSIELTMEMMCGMQSAYPSLLINPSRNIILLNRERSHRVALLCGCGAGHEPFGSGFVGENMLTGFVCGPIFDSPPIGSITIAINHLSEWNRGGVLVFIVNTSGSKLSFGLAVERARAKGINIRSTILLDDCSIQATNITDECLANRRSLAGAAIYIKVLGGLASSGRDMEELLWEERLIKSRMASASVCYSPSTLPGMKRPLFRLKWGAVSLGVGTNGEQGGHYTFRFRPLNEIIKILIDRLLPRCMVFDEGSVAVLISSLGQLTKMESYLIANFVNEELVSRGIEVVRLYTGVVFTSLNMKGFTLTLTNVKGKQLWIDQLDLETEAFAWPGTRLSIPGRWPQREFLHDTLNVTDICGKELNHREVNDLKTCIVDVCNALMKNKNELDTLCKGTGLLLGTEMNRFAEATLCKLSHSCSFLQTLPSAFMALSSVAEEAMSTSASGSIYSLLLLGAALGSEGLWTEIWESAVNTLTKYSTAKIGHRSLVDSLVPACGVFRRVIERDGAHSWRTALKAAVEAAEESCTDTITMVSKASDSPFYRDNTDEGMEEAGARAVVIVLRAVFAALCPHMEQPGYRRASRRVSSITYGRDRDRATDINKHRSIH